MAGNRIVLDSGAVAALANGEEAIRYATVKALEHKIPVVVPTVVVAESTTTGGPRDSAINRALKIGTLVGCDATIARAAAAIRYRDGAQTSVIDAIVVATADRILASVVLTGDVADLRRLAQVRGTSRVLDITGPFDNDAS